MGDIGRHRNIFFNTREAIPADLLAKCQLTRKDLTFVELGNYLTDVSQFRDPVSYIFAKQRVWRDFVMPKVGDKAALKRGLYVLGANAAAAGLMALDRPRNAAAAALLGAAPGFITNDLLGGLFGADTWIDLMFGTPFEGLGAGTRRSDESYGYVGKFFQHFIEGITHYIFASEATRDAAGEWKQIDRVPGQAVDAAFGRFFTQYYPHEHTDQPPYVWDASERPKRPDWYARYNYRDTSPGAGGVMNAVHEHYIRYLAEGLTRLEDEGRKIASFSPDVRQAWLVRMGKILHGIEDWYFHSNIVELIRLRGHDRPKRANESDEQFLRRFVEETFGSAEPARRAEFQRRLYRVLRFPAYERGDRKNSAGIPCKKSSKRCGTMSTPSLDHAYPAFPSQQDTAHTLMGALETLELKIEKGAQGGMSTTSPLWDCVLKKFGQSHPALAALAGLYSGTLPAGGGGRLKTVVMREVVPLILTLLDEDERQRLLAGVAPEKWDGRPVAYRARQLPSVKKRSKHEVDEQIKRHSRALRPSKDAHGITENHYQRAARYAHECGFINERGRAALQQAFEIDYASDRLLEDAPGAGGFLMRFALDLQDAVDAGDEATADQNERGAVFEDATDSGPFNEIIGSHSLMSKDTPTSSPFFDDARVLASVASLSVLQMMLESISAAPDGKGLQWQTVLRFLIRYPVPSQEWERHALAYFAKNKRAANPIPAFAEFPELQRLAQSARVPLAALDPFRNGRKTAELEEMYTKLERVVSRYRYPLP